MKKVLLFFITFLLLALCACSNAKNPTPKPSGTAAAANASSKAAVITAYGTTASVEVKSSVSYIWTDSTKTTLYGAVEYKNTGNSPVIIKSAKFKFAVGSTNIENSFEPIAAASDIVAPGESSYITCWLPVTQKLPAGVTPTLTAELQCEKSTQTRFSLEIRNLFVADNYPTYSTLSGTLFNDNSQDCSVNIVYVGFYDAAGKLIGVWHFSKYATIAANDYKDFVVQMKELPIQGLGKNAAQIRGVSFGAQ